MRTSTRLFTVCVLTASFVACGKKVDDKSKTQDPPAPKGTTGSGSGTGAAPTPAASSVPGVDPEKKVITLGALNDESGPAKSIGAQFANGKRLLVKAHNGGSLPALPDGWKLELAERDHGYNPQQAKQLYKELQPKVLLFATSFGTPPTLPLVEDLQRDDVIAFPASLSTEMAKNEVTPPLGSSYQIEAMRAFDWAVENAGGADKVKAGIIYQRDDYGADGQKGWAAAAEHHKVKVVAEQAVKATDQDFTAVVKAMKDAGATHVLLTVLPNHTPGILGTAAKMKYAPVWIGQTPTWVDVFFAKLPAPLLGTFHWVTSLTYWGEDVPGMKDFLEVWKKYGEGMGDPDFYILSSYVVGRAQLEILRAAIEAKQLDRAGVKKALHTLTKFDAGGLIQPIDLSKVPYVTSTQARVLKPDLAAKTWKTVGPWADPKSLSLAASPK